MQKLDQSPTRRASQPKVVPGKPSPTKQAEEKTRLSEKEHDDQATRAQEIKSIPSNPATFKRTQNDKGGEASELEIGSCRRARADTVVKRQVASPAERCIEVQGAPRASGQIAPVESRSCPTKRAPDVPSVLPQHVFERRDADVNVIPERKVTNAIQQLNRKPPQNLSGDPSGSRPPSKVSEAVRMFESRSRCSSSSSTGSGGDQLPASPKTSSLSSSSSKLSRTSSMGSSQEDLKLSTSLPFRPRVRTSTAQSPTTPSVVNQSLSSTKPHNPPTLYSNAVAIKRVESESSSSSMRRVNAGKVPESPSKLKREDSGVKLTPKEALLIRRVQSSSDSSPIRNPSPKATLQRADSSSSSEPKRITGDESQKRSSVRLEQVDPNQLSHRARVVGEVISSEKIFLGLMQDFLECYYVALSAERDQASMDFMSRSTLVSLCSNIEQIAAVSQQLLSELTLATSSVDDPSKSELGDVFLCTSSLLKLYGQYAENHSAARHDIRLMMNSQAFRAFWERTETDAMLGRGPGAETPRVPSTSAGLDGYLILPIQRVPRYLLLLKELIKTTPQDLMKKESQNLERAIEEVGNAAKFMNECIWRAEQKEILRDLQNKFVGTVVDFIGGVGLAGYRALIFEGELVRVTSKNVHRTYYFHLMNDALVYSRATGNGGFRFHRALSLNGSCSITESPPVPNPAYDVYTNDSKLSCAFKVSTPEKSFVVYAAKPELKRQWVDSIEGVIRAQAALEAQVKEKSEREGAAKRKAEGREQELGSTEEETVTAPTLYSATDKCQMCRSTLYVFTRRLNCERCGLSVCGTCGSNQRVLPGKLKAKQLRMTLPVCCACAWEMDGTAVDTSVDEFRLKLWVEDVQSLVGGVGGHAIVESSGDRRGRHLDAVEALKRLYFSVTSKHRSEERYRGPSNAGVLGTDAAFSVPVGLPSDDALANVTLHVHMVGVGEIGRVPIRLDSIVTQPEVTRAQPFHKWHVVAPNPSTTAISTLAITLIQSTGKDGIHLQLSEKERGALRIGLKVCFELQVPPSLWGAHFHPSERPRAMSTATNASATHHNNTGANRQSRAFSLSTNRPGAAKAVSQTAELEDDVAIRLRRFMGLDDPAFSVGGTNVDTSASGLREKLNVSLLSEYERRVVKNPTMWGLMLTDTLYSDCLAHFGAMAKTRASLYSDTQLTLLNRLRTFHAASEIAGLLQQQAKDRQPQAPRLPERVLERDNRDVLLQAAQRQASQQEGRRPSRNIEITRLALLGRDRDKQKLKAKDGQEIEEEEEEEAQEEKQDADDRETILKQLFESEKGYLESLMVLDEVFISRLTQVAQGADIRLATQKRNKDDWAEKMGLSGAQPTMTTGIQAMNTGVIGRAKSLIQRSPSKMFSKELFNRSPGGHSPGGFSPTKGGSDRRSQNHGASRDGDGGNDDEDSDVRSILKQPFVTVLMQSVKQIRTVNQEFYNSLMQRIEGKGRFTQDVNVGDILERFAGIMPVYSTYASHQPFALEELTNARTEEEGWDARWSMGARANLKSLDALLTACEADAQCAGRTLKDFLTIPLERVETYRSALSALLMCTPRTHPDWNRMRLALGRIVESTKHMTRAVRRRENLDRLREIEATVEDWPEGFNLIEPRRWLVREGCLIERQTFAKRETHRARYFWLFSDCIVMATKINRGGKTLQKLKSWSAPAEVLAQLSTAVSSTLSPPSASGDKNSNVHKYRFKRIINIADMTICDLPHGVQSSSSGLILGDPFFAFCIASVSSPSFVALVPNNPTDCSSKAGPAPVELARVGPPPAHSLATGESTSGRQPVVYDKAGVKSAWISDILLCIELFQRKAVFDDDEGIQQLKSASPNKLENGSFRRSVRLSTGGADLKDEAPGAKVMASASPRFTTNENPVFSPVKATMRPGTNEGLSPRPKSSRAAVDEDDDNPRASRILEKEDF